MVVATLWNTLGLPIALEMAETVDSLKSRSKQKSGFCELLLHVLTRVSCRGLFLILVPYYCIITLVCLVFFPRFNFIVDIVSMFSEDSYFKWRPKDVNEGKTLLL